MKLDNNPFIDLDEPAHNIYDDPMNNGDNDLIINLDDSPINNLEDHQENNLDDNNLHNNLDDNLITNLDDDLIQMVDSSIQTDNDISNMSNDLPEKSTPISNAVQVLSELIQGYQMSDTVRYNLSRTILFLIVDEHCSIINMKRAIHSFNLLLNQNPVVTSVVIQDPRLYGSLQILGRKIPGVGDYECQALLFEALYRITCDENREYWADIWFSNNSKAKNMFLNVDPQKFELNCRKALNCINSHEQDRRVFSIIANYVSFGPFELKPPADCPFWVDFNYDSESVSFYCSELSVNDSLNQSEYWETILINDASVESFCIQDNVAEAIKQVTLKLNCPCHNLITTSDCTNPALNSFEINLSFNRLYDVYNHLEKIYGKKKYDKAVVDIMNIENGHFETSLNENFHKRKVFDSSPVPLESVENENIIPETGEAKRFRKISESSEVIEINPQEEYTLDGLEIHHTKRIYNSEVVHLSPEIETFQNESIFQKYSGEIKGEITLKRKVSCSSIIITIEDDSKHQEIQSSDKLKKKLTRSQRKKTSKLSVDSTFLNNINSDVLMNVTTDKDRTNIEVESNSKSSTNKVINKSSISLDIIAIDFLNPKYGKNNILQENTDSVAAEILDGKEIIHIIDKGEINKQDNSNSVTSGTFADISVIEDSQSENPELIGKTEQNLKNNQNMPTSETLKLSNASKRKSSLVQAVSHMNSNGLQDDLEDDCYEIIKSPKLSSAEMNGIQEKPTNIGQKRKKRMRRRSERIKAMRISPASETSSSLTDINIESLKLRKNNFITDVEKKKEISNMEEETYESFTTANIQGNNDITAKTQVNDCILDKNLHYSDHNHNLTEINKVKKIKNENNDKKSDILDENVVVIEDSLNEKCFETVVQNNENKYPKNMATNDELPLSKKLKTCVMNDTSVRSQDNSKVSNVRNESQVTDESSKTIYSESSLKKQSKKVRLYNLDNAPVYDVPPSKSPNRSFSPKEVHAEHPVSTVCELDASNEDGYNRKSNLSRKKNLNIIKNRTLSISDKKKMEAYDIIQDSDEDFEENSRRYFRERKKRPMTLSSYKGTSSKKKKTEASQTDIDETPIRTRREAALKAMKVNKRILDPTTEVACDEIEILRESDDSPKTPVDQPIKKRKYAKVFSSGHTDTETGSSEVSWLKPKTCPLFESPKRSYSEVRKNQQKKCLPVKHSTKKSERKKKKNAHHSVNIETGSKSKSTTWSEFENFNLIIEKGTKKSHSVLKDLENELQNLSSSSYSRSVKSAVKDLSLNQPVQESFLNNNIESKDGSGEINLLGEYIEPNTDYNNACDDIQDIDYEERQSYNVINDKYNYDENVREIKQSRKQKQTSSNSAISDEISPLEHPVKPASPLSQSAESNDSFHMEKKSKSSQSSLPEDEHGSEFTTDRNIDCLVPNNNETENKKWLLQRFLEYSVEFSNCVKSSSSSNINPGLNYSKGHTAENNEKARRAKTESPVSCTRQKNNNCLSSSDFSIFKHTFIKDLLGEKFKHYKNSLHDDLSLRNSADLAYLEKNRNGVRCANKMKQKKMSSAADEMPERPRKRSKLHENLDHLKNCTLDCLSLRRSSEPSSGKKHSRSMDNHNFGNKTTKKTPNFENEELNQSGNRIKKTNLKSNNVDNSLHSKITTISFKEIETDRNWFNRITFTLSQDADNLTRKLLATVQKIYVDYSAKMCFLREAVFKATESFELSPKQNTLKLKNLIQTCSIIRLEVEKSLNAMQMIGKEYFAAEENNYRKLNRKYIKANKKYFSGMQNAKKDAIRKLEGNVYLKAKYFFRKFLKYIDSA